MKVTYYGHACFSAQIGSRTLLFDPFISGNELAKAIDVNKVPADYIRKQTLVNAERYITPEMKEVEVRLLNADEEIHGLEPVRVYVAALVSHHPRRQERVRNDEQHHVVHAPPVHLLQPLGLLVRDVVEVLRAQAAAGPHRVAQQPPTS